MKIHQKKNDYNQWIVGEKKKELSLGEYLSATLLFNLIY
jgi:hypothetical protein